MTNPDIIILRLANQQISSTALKKPEQIVEHMGAMQAQEYAMSKWAIGLRLPGSTDTNIEKSFNEGKILRTHLLRPTWHFVSTKDIRWMLTLTAPQIHKANGFMCRKLGLGDALLKKATTFIGKTLAGGNHLTRNELKDLLEKNKMHFEGPALAYMLMFAELEGVVCSGPRHGKQFTYALLDERAPEAKNLNREESLAELSKRYFTSRGPATLQDFSTWSGLSLKDGRAGIESLGRNFIREKHEGREYIFPSNTKKTNTPLASFLMPDYDEYGMGYKDRSAIFDDKKYREHVSRGNPVFNRMIIIDGVIAGTWTRSIKKNKVVVETFPFGKLSGAKQKSLQAAVEQFLNFNGNAEE